MVCYFKTWHESYAVPHMFYCYDLIRKQHHTASNFQICFQCHEGQSLGVLNLHRLTKS